MQACKPRLRMVLVTPPRLIAWRRLLCHLAGGYVGAMLLILQAHPEATAAALLRLAWATYRPLATAYLLGYIANSLKTMEGAT